MRPTTLAEMAERYGVEVPPIRGFGSFPEFSGMYVAACAVLREEADLRRVVDEVVEDAVLAGAHWVEPSFYAPHHRARFGRDEDIVELVLDALADSATRHGIDAGLMLAADRTTDPDEAIEQARLAARFTDRGVVAFGLANDEAPWPPEPFAAAFAIAKDAGLLSTPHAGAATPARRASAAPSTLWEPIESSTACERSRTRTWWPASPTTASAATCARRPTCCCR